MDTFLSLTATEWTGIYALLTAGLLLVAILAAWYAHRQWKVARAQAVAQRLAQMETLRPFVTVTVEPSPASMKMFDLVVRNVGQRPAQDVRIQIDPPPVRALEEKNKSFEISKMKMLTEPIAQIAPGQEIGALYDSHVARKGREDLPTRHQAEVTYLDSGNEKYQGTFTLDLDALRGMLYADVGTIHTLSQATESIAKTLKSSDLIGKGSLAVQAVVQSQDEHEKRSILEEHETYKDFVRMAGQFTPGDPSVTVSAKKVAKTEEWLQREIEREAVESLLRRARQVRNAYRYLRRSLRQKDRTERQR